MRPEDIRAIQQHAREAREYAETVREAQRVLDLLGPSVRVATDTASAAAYARSIVGEMEQSGVASPAMQRAIEEWSRTFSRSGLVHIRPELLGRALAPVSNAMARRVREIVEAQRLAHAVDLERFRSLRLDTAAGARRFRWRNVEMEAIGMDRSAAFSYEGRQFADSVSHLRDGARFARSLSPVIENLQAITASWAEPVHLAAALQPLYDRMSVIEATYADLHRARRARASEDLSAASGPVLVVDDGGDSRFTEKTVSGIAVPGGQPIAVEPQSAPGGLHIVEGGPEARFNATADAIADAAASRDLVAALNANTAALNAHTQAMREDRQQLAALIETIARIVPTTTAQVRITVVSGLIVAVMMLFPSALAESIVNEKIAPQETGPAPAPEQPVPLCVPRQDRPALGQRNRPGRELRRAA